MANDTIYVTNYLGGNMLSTSKIENRALNALENIIVEHPTMDCSFNSMDKEMAWDGYIWIFKNDNAGTNKRNLDDKIPVQIKGHIDDNKSYINKMRISYHVSVEDLTIYFNDRGVIYFQIFMTSDNRQREVFYSSLFPTKIKSYLERAKQKQKEINIVFTKLNKNPKDLYCIMKQFSNESKTQGFGVGQIVQNTIPLKNLDKVKTLSATIVGCKSEYDFLMRYASGDICFYATMEGNPFKLPLEWTDKGRIYIKKIVCQNVTVNNTVYYNQFTIKVSSEKENILFLGKNLKINLTKGILEIIPSSNIKELRNDADFIYGVMKKEQFYLGKWMITCKNIKIPDDLNESLQHYIEMDEALSMIEFNYDKPFTQIQEDDLRQILLLADIMMGRMDKQLPELSKFNWKIENKYIPTIIMKNDVDSKNRIINSVYTRKYQVLVSNDEKTEYYKVTSFHHIPGDIFANMYEFDYDILRKQIDQSEVNEYTIGALNESVLQLINAYDINRDIQLLDLADYQLSRIKKEPNESYITTMNQLQIRKRKGILNEDDIIALKDIETDDAGLLCGINILLEEKEKAKSYYNKMTSEEHELFNNYPIYHLYKNLLDEKRT